MLLVMSETNIQIVLTYERDDLTILVAVINLIEGAQNGLFIVGSLE